MLFGFEPGKLKFTGPAIMLELAMPLQLHNVIIVAT